VDGSLSIFFRHESSSRTLQQLDSADFSDMLSGCG